MSRGEGESLTPFCSDTNLKEKDKAMFIEVDSAELALLQYAMEDLRSRLESREWDDCTKKDKYISGTDNLISKLSVVE